MGCCSYKKVSNKEVVKVVVNGKEIKDNIKEEISDNIKVKSKINSKKIFTLVIDIYLEKAIIDKTRINNYFSEKTGKKIIINQVNDVNLIINNTKDYKFEIIVNIKINDLVETVHRMIIVIE